MRNIKHVLPVMLLSLVMAGCTTTTITNLTPQVQSRNTNGLYPIEAALASSQQSVRWSSIEPNVVIGNDFYPMRPTPLMTNRWETLVPVPEGKDVVYYHFKFDYRYNSFGPAQPDSKLSPSYRLLISDNK
jgi:hypothetical protein